jgi:hypothetical protein
MGFLRFPNMFRYQTHIMSHHEPSNISLPRWPTKAPPHRFLPGRLQRTLEWRNVAPLPSLPLYIERDRKKKKETGAVLACDLWSSTFYLLNEGHECNILTLGMWVPDRKGPWPDWRIFNLGRLKKAIYSWVVPKTLRNPIRMVNIHFCWWTCGSLIRGWHDILPLWILDPLRKQAQHHSKYPRPDESSPRQPFLMDRRTRKK